MSWTIKGGDQFSALETCMDKTFNLYNQIEHDTLIKNICFDFSAQTLFSWISNYVFEVMKEIVESAYELPQNEKKKFQKELSFDFLVITATIPHALFKVGTH